MAIALQELPVKLMAVWFMCAARWLVQRLIASAESSPIRYMSSSSVGPRTTGNRTDALRSESSGLFVRSPLSGAVSARNRRHDINSDLLESGGRNRKRYVDENGMPVSDADLRSDAATFSNLNPNTSDADVLGGTNSRIVWGTNVSVNDAISTVKDFLRNFQKKYRMLKDGEIEDIHNLPADHPGHAREYIEMMNTMLDLGVTALNLDARNFKAYPGTVKLWHQLQSFPAEIIPAIDVSIKDIMIELAEKRMGEMRTASQQHAVQNGIRTRDSSSAPPLPSSDIDAPATARPTLEPLNDLPDLVQEVESRIYKVRPFGLDSAINLRDLNPGDMDKLVSVKGLVIRTTPIIPDMKEGEYIRDWILLLVC